MIDKLNNWLDKYVLPWPVRFLRHRFFHSGNNGAADPPARFCQ